MIFTKQEYKNRLYPLFRLCLQTIPKVSYTEIGRHIINQSNNVIYEDRKNQVYGIG